MHRGYNIDFSFLNSLQVVQAVFFFYLLRFLVNLQSAQQYTLIPRWQGTSVGK
jgi:hypothetical protein